MDTRNFAIGVLSITAMILFVGLLVMHAQAPAAHASGMTASDRGGNYSFTVGRINPNEEWLYVIDSRRARLVVYRYNGMQRQIDLVTGLDLNEMRSAVNEGSQQAPGQQPTTPKSGRQRGRRP
jgi:hypothetical protein